MAATTNRLRHLFQQNSHHFLRRLFSSSVNQRGTGSTAYQQILKTQRPPTIQWHKDLKNSVSFIGRVYYPIKTITRPDGVLCAFTHLKLDSHNSISIFIDMWEDMAELAIQHLKPNDHIYVSGYLRSFKKVYDSRSIKLWQKVIVKEINYVANNNQKTKNIEDQRESALEKERKRLQLWQVFFANPYEWWDSRKSKVNPRQPDFKHKGTGEALWLSQQDPPWVMRQLQLQDSRMGEMGRFTSRSNLSKFTYNDI